MSNPQYLHHDNTLEYIHPMQPVSGAPLSIYLRAGSSEVQEAVLLWDEKEEIPMSFEENRNGFDFFLAKKMLGESSATYIFRVTFKDGETVFYDKRGHFSEGDESVPGMAFYLIPDFRVPEWARGAVFYQIMVDRFCNGDPSNDVLTNEYHYLGNNVRRVYDWYRPPDPFRDYDEFYGGDLQGIIEKLPYLSDLGIEAIYLNPIFVSPSSHKYDTQDYDHIDPHIGRIVVDYGRVLTPEEHDNRNATRYIDRVTNPENLNASDELFAKLVNEAHERGIKVILDGVFNHCGSFNKWLDREGIYEQEGHTVGAFASADSLFREFFSFGEDNWPDNTSYESWWGNDTLPKLNYEGSEALQEYIIDVGRKWVSAPYFADGWRLDVAADLGHSAEFNHSFWKKFRKAVKEANPEAIIIAEHYGNAREWLKGDEWDSVMNYDAFMEPVTFFLTGMEKHSDEYHPSLEGDGEYFRNAMRYQTGENFTIQSLYTAMNELSNHDHSRFLTRTNHMVGRAYDLGSAMADRYVKKHIFRQAVLIQFTWTGCPTIYYGDEAGLCGFTDPDNRRTYPWGREDKHLIEYHKALIRIRGESPELRYGSARFVLVEKGLIAYGRFTKNRASLVVINMNDYALTRDIEVRILGIPESCRMQRRMITTEYDFGIEKVDHRVEDGVLTLHMPPRSGKLVVYDSMGPLSEEEFWRNNFIDFEGD